MFIVIVTTNVSLVSESLFLGIVMFLAVLVMTTITRESPVAKGIVPIVEPRLHRSHQGDHT